MIRDLQSSRGGTSRPEVVGAEPLQRPSQTRGGEDRETWKEGG